jgi:hypothetical protein
LCAFVSTGEKQKKAKPGTILCALRRFVFIIPADHLFNVIPLFPSSSQHKRNKFSTTIKSKQNKKE